MGLSASLTMAVSEAKRDEDFILEHKLIYTRIGNVGGRWTLAKTFSIGEYRHLLNSRII